MASASSNFQDAKVANSNEGHFERVLSTEQSDILKTGEQEVLRPKVHFNLFQAIGMNFSVTATPVAVGAYLSLIIGLGGFPYFVWCFVFTGSFQLVLGLVLAEIASALPHSSGKSE